jgi:hypothetical protein
MTNWGAPIFGNQAEGGINGGGGNSNLKTVQTSGSNFTFGSWNQLWGATEFETHCLGMQFHNNNNGDLILTNIAIGPAASEEILIENVCTLEGLAGGATGAQLNLFPIYIPKGSRVTVQTSAASATDYPKMGFHLFPRGMFGAQGCGQSETLGVSTGTNRATVIDPGSSANTKGAWTTVGASTGFPYKFMLVFVTFPKEWTSAGGTRRNCMMDIGIGSSGNEVILIPDLYFRVDEWQRCGAPQSVTWPVSVPAGARISARCQSEETTIVQREFEVSVIGFG